jgi:hypothetical protein
LALRASCAATKCASGFFGSMASAASSSAFASLAFFDLKSAIASSTCAYASVGALCTLFFASSRSFALSAKMYWFL